MFGRFLPKEGKFFDLFNAHAREIIQGADRLVALLVAMNEAPDTVSGHAAAIDEIEARADKITYETLALLHSTFITPLDRDEIHQLIIRLDNVLDTIQGAVQTLSVYDIRHATPATRQFADIIREGAGKLAEAVGMLSNMNNGKAILDICRDLDRLENDADRVLREAMSRLFREEEDVRELIKYKAVYEQLETVTDHCDSVGNILEAIVLENS